MSGVPLYGIAYRRASRVFGCVIDSGLVPREQKMLKGHLPRVIYHQMYEYTKIFLPRSPAAGRAQGQSLL